MGPVARHRYTFHGHDLGGIRLAELALEAGLPPGVFNVVPGLGEEAGKALALHRDVDMIAFTGSTEVGKLMMRYAGESNLKRVALELGGKSPHVVMADADLEQAAAAIAWGIYYNAGETCHAGSRLIVHEQVRAELIEGIELCVASGPRLWIASVKRRGTEIAERQQVRRFLLLRNLQGFLVFPFSPSYWRTTINAAVFARRGPLW